MKPHLFILLSVMGAWAPVWGMIGLRGLVTGKPFVVSLRLRIAAWAILMGYLFFLFLYLSGGGSKTPGGVVGDVAVFVAVWTVVVVFFTLRFSSGYSVYGVTDASFRAGLLASLAKLNLTHEQTPTGLRLPTIDKDLLVTAPGTMWKTGSVDMKQPDSRGALRDIAKGMNEYYRSEAVVEVKPQCFWVRVLLAFVSAVITGLIFSWRLGHL